MRPLLDEAGEAKVEEDMEGVDEVEAGRHAAVEVGNARDQTAA